MREEGDGHERGENKKHGDTEDNGQRGKQLEERKVTRKENKEKGKTRDTWRTVRERVIKHQKR